MYIQYNFRKIDVGISLRTHGLTNLNTIQYYIYYIEKACIEFLIIQIKTFGDIDVYDFSYFAKYRVTDF